MGRHPQIHSLLFCNPNQKPEDAIDALSQCQPMEIPECITEGFLHGLLTYFLSGGKKRRRRQGISADVIVPMLLGYSQAWAAAYSDELKKGKRQTDLAPLYRSKAAQIVPELFADAIRHPGRAVLEWDSDVVVRKLEGYTTVKDHQRMSWLRARLPAILTSLKRKGLCRHPACLARIELPSDRDLGEWTRKPNVGKLRHNILAHFHGSTESTTIRTLSSKFPPNT